ncbi:hypothetical protein SO802_027007 [Lithocarpus litseifolius]|uniref:Uncharacterized protein n=1 Tax=Lithocarpus litseifolius TaxID=425828 RepID=A0AAW2C1Q9_9ROSI
MGIQFYHPKVDTPSGKVVMALELIPTSGSLLGSDILEGTTVQPSTGCLRAMMLPTRLGPEMSGSRLKVQEWGQGRIMCCEAWARGLEAHGVPKDVDIAYCHEGDIALKRGSGPNVAFFPLMAILEGGVRFLVHPLIVDSPLLLYIDVRHTNFLPPSLTVGEALDLGPRYTTVEDLAPLLDESTKRVSQSRKVHVPVEEPKAQARIAEPGAVEGKDRTPPLAASRPKKKQHVGDQPPRVTSEAPSKTPPLGLVGIVIWEPVSDPRPTAQVRTDVVSSSRPKATQLTHILDERLKELAEDAEQEKALKDVVVATAKEKDKVAEAAKKKAQSSKKARLVAERKLAEAGDKLGGIELKLAEAASLNLA